MTEYDITVAGIPAIARVTDYTPADPGNPWGPIDRCCPAEPAVLEFELLDRRGRPAPWLERKADATRGERDRIEGLLLDRMQDDPY
jgi:hypothetical protein